MQPRAKPQRGALWPRPCAFCVLCLVAGWVHAASDVDEARAELATITAELNALDRWLTDAGERRISLLRELADQDKQIAQVQGQVATAEERLRQLDQELDTLRTEQQRLQALRAEQARRITEHLAASYRLSGQDFVKLVFNQGSPETIDRMMQYHRYFSAARLEALASYQSTLEELDGTAEKLDDSLEAQRVETEALSDRQRALADERQTRQGVIDELDAEAETRTQQRTRLQGDHERLTRLVRELELRSRELGGEAFVERKGRLAWPVRGKVRHRFGQSRAGGRLKWSGTVFDAPMGTDITAVASGRVVYADWLRGFGLLTIIDHGSGYMTLYGHADLITRQVGDRVENGEIIGAAGQSGGQTAPGVYFEVRHKGEAQDPHGWLAASAD